MLRRGTALVLMLMPAAADMLPLTPAQCALLGQEPYASIAESALPLPPTPESVKALPPLVFARQQEALKETLLLRWSLIRAAGHRTNREVDADSAGLAREAEAPEIIADIYQRFADDNLTRAEAYGFTSLLELVLHAYQTDELGVRLLTEEADVAPEDAVKLAAFLPLTDAFNLLPLRPPTAAQVTADLRCMQREYATLATIYEGVTDAEAAEQAAEQARPVVQRLLTTGRTMALLKDPQTLLSPEQSEALKAANEAYAHLSAQRERLQKISFGSSLRLRALDILAE